ncbi:aminotransferase class V-fold PLP-dependent enzyme [Microtetraspora malaysiensis]|uniref:aminotransferase class V-fold PLP-dependent enzyme n=1 Tax=Microtetraspora malaysiensis TaxID=161358 RepID=UPI003D928CAB
MKDIAQNEFPLAPGIVLLNHASYGITSRRVLAAAQAMQHEIDSDPTMRLGSALLEPLRKHTDLFAETVGLNPAGTTLCTNATTGAAAIIASAALDETSTVVALETEYSSILRGWEIATERSGATLVRIPVQLPFDGPDQLIERLEATVPGDIAYLQMSLVSSSSAVHFPMAEMAAWAHSRGGRLIVDAAHGPGHVPLDPIGWGADAVFGTIHKWFPALRPIGFLWLAEDLIDTVRPAEVSLTWDSPDLVERFSWPGTFDPVSRLSLPVAIEQWRQWEQQGAWAECVDLAGAAVESFTSIGARPTATSPYQPPRLRAFILDEMTVAEVKELTTQAGIRAWVGPGAEGECILRIATHVYNDITDIETVVSQLKGALRR